MTEGQIDIPEMLRLHRLWLFGGAAGQWANLQDADLRDANLSRADLRDAILRDADLRGADMAGAHLSGAHLRHAHLSGADLSGADLRGADMAGAHLGRTVVVQSGPLGSRRDYLVTVWHPDWPREEVRAGCWTGTLEDLAVEVAVVHWDNPRCMAEYQAAIAYHQASLTAWGWVETAASATTPEETP